MTQFALGFAVGLFVSAFVAVAVAVFVSDDVPVRTGPYGENLNRW